MLVSLALDLRAIQEAQHQHQRNSIHALQVSSSSTTGNCSNSNHNHQGFPTCRSTNAVRNLFTVPCIHAPHASSSRSKRSLRWGSGGSDTLQYNARVPPFSRGGSRFQGRYGHSHVMIPLPGSTRLHPPSKGSQGSRGEHGVHSRTQGRPHSPNQEVETSSDIPSLSRLTCRIHTPGRYPIPESEGSPGGLTKSQKPAPLPLSSTSAL